MTRIRTAAHHLPGPPLANAEFVARFGYPMTAEEIEQKTDIRTRHFAGPEDSTVSMASAVVAQLLDRAPEIERRVDVLIFTSYTGEQACPSAAATIAQRVGLRPGLAFDLSAACAGFAAGVDVAHQYLRSGCERAIVVSSEAQSRCLIFERPHHALGSIFADGAGGVLLERSDSGGIRSAVRASAVEGAPFLQRYHGEVPSDPAYPQGKFFYPHRNELSYGWVDVSVALGKRALEEASSTISEVRWLISHQARPGLSRLVADGLGAPREKLYVNADRVGNLASASVPVALSELEAAGQLERGDSILMIGAGAGFTGAAFLLDW